MANMILAGALRGLGRAGMSIGQQYPAYMQNQRQLLVDEDERKRLRDERLKEFEYNKFKADQAGELNAMKMRRQATVDATTATHQAGLLGQSTLRTENQVASNRAAEGHDAATLALRQKEFDFKTGAGATLAGTAADQDAYNQLLRDVVSQRVKGERIEEGLPVDYDEPRFMGAAGARAYVDSLTGRTSPVASGGGGMGGYPTFGGFGVGGYSLTGAGAGVNPTAAPGGGQLLQTAAPGGDAGVLQTGGQREALTQMQAMGAESYDDVFQWSRSNPKKSDGTPYSEIEIEEFLMIAGIAFGRTR